MLIRKPLFFLPLCILAGFLAGCANQNQFNALQARLAQQDQQIQQLRAQLSGVQPAQADTWAQVQSLRQEMGSVKGQIDDFNNATASTGGVAALSQKLAQHEQALQAIQTQFAMDLHLNQPVAGAANTPPVQNAAPQALATATNPANTASTVQPVTTPQTAAPAAQASADNTDIAKALYDAGIKSFDLHKYNEAVNAFSDFTRTYPMHRLAGNAWFWLGESNFQNKNYSAAALNYNQVIDHYSSSGKVASSYLKQAMCFSKLNKKDAAKYRLEELIKKYPKTPEATRAKQVLKTL